MLALLLLLLQAQRYNRDGTRMKISANTLVLGRGRGFINPGQVARTNINGCIFRDYRSTFLVISFSLPSLNGGGRFRAC